MPFSINSTSMRLELSLRVLARLRTCAAILAGRLTLCLTILWAVGMAALCTIVVHIATCASACKPLGNIGRGFLQVCRAAEVAPVKGVGAEGGDFFVGFGEAEVGVDDGEDAGFGDEG